MKNRLLTKNTSLALILMIVISLVLIMMPMMLFFNNSQEKEEPAFYSIKKEWEIKISPFESENERILFLPSGFTKNDLDIDKSELEELEIIELKEIPTVFIETKIGDIGEVDSDPEKNTSARAELTILDTSGVVVEKEMTKLSGRGNTSWLYDKKPYNVTFDEPINVLGMGESRKWCLLANSTDYYGLSNKVVYDFASKLDFAYVPDVCFVNVFINGQYNGLYQFSEKIEVSKNRLNPDRKDLYLLETDLNIDIYKAEDFFITKGNNIIEVCYPNVVSDSLKKRINDEVQEFEDALLDLHDQRWKDLIDIDSWARIYILDELFENLDGGFYSVFFYKNNEGKYVRGPVWDYDKILYYENDQIMVGNEIRFPNEININYNYYLLQKPVFFERVREIFEKEFLPIAEEELIKNVTETADLIRTSAEADCMRWKREYKSSEEMIRLIKNRTSFLRKYFADPDRYCKVQIEDSTGYLRDYIVEKGYTIKEVADLDESLLDTVLFYRNSGERFDSEDIIEKDICLVRNTKFEQTIPVISITETRTEIGLINSVFVVLFMFCFSAIIYIIITRVLNGKVSS